MILRLGSFCPPSTGNLSRSSIWLSKYNNILGLFIVTSSHRVACGS
uniref:Uncharacterized protein n=1 Tax=Anguilla anguilla TaxID=7936 RepID=A0A0E9T2N5_ANGAN